MSIVVDLYHISMFSCSLDSNCWGQTDLYLFREAVFCDSWTAFYVKV